MAQTLGLIVMRGQVIHYGHLNAITKMMVDNDKCVVAYGSSQKYNIAGNPLTAQQRLEAHRLLFGDSVGAVLLDDIGATETITEWYDYVLQVLTHAGYGNPTDYYAGSINDARWYAHAFAPLDKPLYSSNGTDVYENCGRRIHVINRDNGQNLSSSFIRNLIELRDDTWKHNVPRKLWKFYENEYPGKLRAPVKLEDIDVDSPNHPIGTRGIDNHHQIWVLRADRKWRKLIVDESSIKSLGD